MSTKRLALTIAVPVTISGLVAVAIVLKLPEKFFETLENTSAKAFLLVLCLLFSVWIGILLFRLLYVPSVKRFCTQLGSAVVWTALSCAPMPFGVLAIESLHLRYVDTDVNSEAVARIQFSSSSAAITSCFLVLIAGAMGLGFSYLHFTIMAHEQRHGPLN